MSKESELYHHGILGQKWGRRRYQNPDKSLTPEGRIHYGVGEARKSTNDNDTNESKTLVRSRALVSKDSKGEITPIDDKVLKKGTILRSVSDKAINPNVRLRDNKWMYTYNPKNDWDSKVYKGPFSMYMIMGRGARFIAEHEYQTTKDLKMPTRQERIDVFKEVCNDRKYKKNMINELGVIQQRLAKSGIGSEGSRTVNLKNLKTDKDYESAYEIFNHAMEAMHNYKTTRGYADKIMQKYDAMVDDNNVGVYNDANDPVIIFKTEDLISTNGDKPVSMLTIDEIDNNAAYVKEKLQAMGKQVKL